MRRSVRPSGPSSSGRRVLLRAQHHLAERLRREQTRYVGGLERRLDACRRHLGQELAQSRESRFGDDPFLLEIGFGQVAARILDDLAARNLHLERTLQAEYQVEEVDRLGIQAVSYT